MVQKIFELLSREVKGLHETAYLIGLFTILSQLLGLIRDRLLAHLFGAGQTLDIYYASFRVPDLVFASVASLVSFSVLIPFLVERLTRDRDRGAGFIDSVFSFFFFLIIAVCAALYLLAPQILPWLMPGFAASDRLSELILLTRILLLSPILLGFSNFLASIIQAHRRFMTYALSPIFYNTGIIAGIIILYPALGVVGLAWGVVAGALLHLLIQVPPAVKTGFFPRLRLDVAWSDIKNVVFLSVSRTFALSVGQLSQFVLIAFASLMAAGSIAVFNFSWNIQSVPLGIIGVSYSVALFPTLSRLISANDRRKFLEKMVVTARHIVFWSVPALVLFIVLRAQIVRTVLGTGQFDWQATRLTAAALAIFAVSLLAQNLVLLFIRAFYAAGDTRVPVAVNTFSAAGTIAMAFLFLKLWNGYPLFGYFIETLFKVESLSGTKVLALVLAASVGAVLNAVALWFIFGRRFKGFSQPVLATFYHSFSASVIMGAIVHGGLNIFDEVFNLNTLPGIFFQGFSAGLFGLAAGVIVLLAMGNLEIQEVFAAFRRKFWRVQAITPEQETL